MPDMFKARPDDGERKSLGDARCRPARVARHLRGLPGAPRAREADVPAAGHMPSHGCSGHHALRLRVKLPPSPPPQGFACILRRTYGDARRTGAFRPDRIPRQMTQSATRRRLIWPASIFTTAAAPSHVGEDDPCPFCDGKTTRKKPALGQTKGTGMPGGTGAPPRTSRSKEPHLTCRDCTREFIRVDKDVKTIAAGLQVEARIAFRIKLYYGDDVTVNSLLAEHLTGMVKKTRDHRPYVQASLAKKELVICFCHNKVRTYGSFIREGGKPSGHYVFKELSKA